MNFLRSHPPGAKWCFRLTPDDVILSIACANSWILIDGSITVERSARVSRCRHWCNHQRSVSRCGLSEPGSGARRKVLRPGIYPFRHPIVDVEIIDEIKVDNPHQFHREIMVPVLRIEITALRRRSFSSSLVDVIQSGTELTVRYSRAMTYSFSRRIGRCEFAIDKLFLSLFST